LHVDSGNGKVGIGTATPTEAFDVQSGNLKISTFTFKPLSSTSLALYDSGNNQLIIFDEGTGSTSDPIWGQSTTGDFVLGSFYQTIATQEDTVRLDRDAKGEFYSNGTFTTVVHEFEVPEDFQKFSATAEILAGTNMTADLESSDDNFSTTKDSIRVGLMDGFHNYDAWSLADAKYFRIIFNFSTNDTSISPQLDSFQIQGDIAGQGRNAPSATDSSESTPEDNSDTTLSISVDSQTNLIQNTESGEQDSLGTTTQYLGKAENYRAIFNGIRNMEAGDLVALDPARPEYVTLSYQSYQPSLVGTVSSEYKVTINDSGGAEFLVPVVLDGRTMLKASLDNGPIEIGDYLTSSEVPGIAMKATQSGRVVGLALEPFTNQATTTELQLKRIAIFLNPHWWSTGTNLAVATSSVDSSDGLFDQLKNIVSFVTDTVTNLSKMVVSAVLEVKNDVVSHGFFKNIVKVAKTVVLGRTIVVDNAVTAVDSQLEVESEDDQSISYVTYSILSPRKEIMLSGSARLLMNGAGEVEAKIAFHPSFSAIISDKVSIKVIVTPTSYINGHLYVAEKSIYGFTIKEISSQDKGAQLDWLVTAKLTDPDLAQEVLGDTEEIASQENTEQVCQNGSNRSCGTEIGVCQIGVQICEQGVWGECIGAVMPSEELCDGVDNDCDGMIDEDGICAGNPAATEPEPGPISTSTEPIAEPEPETTSTTTEPVVEPEPESTATTTEQIIEPEPELTPESETTSTEPIIEPDVSTSTDEMATSTS